MEEKYIKLLLEKCLCLKKNTPLLISYNQVIAKFVKKVVNYAKKMGIKDIYLDKDDSNLIHDELNKMSIKAIKNSSLFDKSIWDEYAKRDAAFLMLESEIPYLMDDIDSKKLAASALQKSISKPIYKKRQLNNEIAWCIAAVPNKEWAKDIFPDSKNPMDDFWNMLASICLLDKKDPIKEWEVLLEKRAKTITKLNNLKIRKLYYKNSLGTNLEISIPDNALWQSSKSGKWIVNMPSYEIFTSPNYKETNGIVYSTKPLIYNGIEINNFNLEFKNGKVVKVNAKTGKDILEEILKGDKLSSYLGEVALVNYDSPISNTNKVFKSTLIDENASCHIALGSGFLECIKNGNKLSKEELDEIGINSSKNHVDFMIGSKDLKVEADTIKGHITIMENGNIIL